MKALASSFGAWRLMEANEGVKVPHGLTFPLAVVQAIGAPFGLELTAEECALSFSGFDAVFLGVLDSRCMIEAKRHFDSWGIPFRSKSRPNGKWPLVWAGGQGLRNPLPLAPIYDLCVLGDAEAPLPELLRLWSAHGNSHAFLESAAAVPGVLVPSVHDRKRNRVSFSVSRDISVTLKNSISVSHDGSRRLEIARGCKSKCLYCSLGWNSVFRENSPRDVIEALELSPKRVHLQAGDAEAHSGIEQIRAAVKERGGSDLGWTGRYDSIMDNPDQVIHGSKRYAFGIEAMSHRIRRAIGKPKLTDDFIVDSTAKLMRSIEGESKGRLGWHLIAGLPTSRTIDAREMLRVLQRIDSQCRGSVHNLSIHWQPFQPLPGTPMQWCAAGTGARKEASLLKTAELQAWCRVRNVCGRTDAMALVCSVLSRSDERGADLLEAIADRQVTPTDAERITGSTFGSIERGSELPWDFIDHPFPRTVLEKAHEIMMERLSGAR